MTLRSLGILRAKDVPQIDVRDRRGAPAALALRHQGRRRDRPRAHRARGGRRAPRPRRRVAHPAPDAPRHRRRLTRTAFGPSGSPREVAGSDEGAEAADDGADRVGGADEADLADVVVDDVGDRRDRVVDARSSAPPRSSTRPVQSSQSWMRRRRSASVTPGRSTTMAVVVPPCDTSPNHARWQTSQCASGHSITTGVTSSPSTA